MLDYLPFLEGYSIIQLGPPKSFIGKSLRELNLINQYGVQVIAIKDSSPDRMNLIPTAEFIIKQNNLIILLGPNEALDKLRDMD